MNPAEGVIVTEVELAGAVTEDDGALTQSSVVEGSAVAGALGGDEAGPLAEGPQLVEVTVPRLASVFRNRLSPSDSCSWASLPRAWFCQYWRV